jgi:hypothetical protein
MNTVGTKRSDWNAWYLLFIIEFVITLWPPFFNRLEPVVFGMPFFYWYQLACVFVGAIITVIVYLRTTRS